MILDKHIYLIGFSGCGKSTLGPGLAEKLRCDFVDTDAVIEERAGTTIAEIFQQQGEPVFREMEAGVVTEIASSKDPCSVVALGGGAIVDERSRLRMIESGLTVYLSCSVRTLARRMASESDRPLLHATSSSEQPSRAALVDRVRKLLDERAPLYRQARFRLSTDGKSVEEAADQLYAMVKKGLAGY